MNRGPEQDIYTDAIRRLDKAADLVAIDAEAIERRAGAATQRGESHR